MSNEEKIITRLRKKFENVLEHCNDDEGIKKMMIISAEESLNLMQYLNKTLVLLI